VNYKRLATLFFTTLLLSLFVIKVPAVLAFETPEDAEEYRQIEIPQQDHARIERFYREDGQIDQRQLEMELGSANVTRARSYSRQARVDLIDVMLLFYLMRNWGRVETYIGWTPGYVPAPVYYTWPVYYVPRRVVYYSPSLWYWHYHYRPFRYRPRPTYYSRPRPPRHRPKPHYSRPRPTRPNYSRPTRPPRTRPQARPQGTHRPPRKR
jgi:hypothetical protein